MPRRQIVLELDRFRTVSEWHHIAILDLISVRGFRADEAWIGRVLGIPKRKVQTALRCLERLGLFERTADQWRKTSARLVVPSIKPFLPLRRLHGELIDKTGEYLKTVSARDYQKYDVTGAIMAVDCSRIPEAKRRIARFRRKLTKFLTDGEPTGLYLLEVQLTPLANLNTETKEKRTE